MRKKTSQLESINLHTAYVIQIHATISVRNFFVPLEDGYKRRKLN